MATAQSDDLAFVRAHVPDYAAYDDEDDRHASDMRVRAFVGVALTETGSRLGDLVSAAARDDLEKTIFACAFTDQVFVRRIEHAVLDDDAKSALVGSDRRLVEYAERAKDVGADGVPALLADVDAQFALRRTLPIG